MRFSFIILAALFVIGAFSGCPPRPTTPRTPGATPAPTPAPTPVPTVSRPPYVPNKRMEVGRMFNGAQVRTQLETDLDLGASASDVRGRCSQIEIGFKLRAHLCAVEHSADLHAFVWHVR